MSVELQILFAAVAAVGTIAGGYWSIARVIVAQFKDELKRRFDALELARQEGSRAWAERMTRMEGKQEELEKDVRQILIELPREYVRREDHIRFETVINAKLDAVAARVDLVLERQQKG